MSDNSFDAAQRALRNRAVVDLEEPLPDEQPTRWWLRVVVLLVFFVFGAIVWLSWQDNAGDGTPVMVQAPEEPIKEKPVDEGGLTPRNAGSEIASVLGENPDDAGEPPAVGPVPSSQPPAQVAEEVEEVIPPADSAAGFGETEVESADADGFTEPSATAMDPAAGEEAGARPSMGEIMAETMDDAAPGQDGVVVDTRPTVRPPSSPQPDALASATPAVPPLSETPPAAPQAPAAPATAPSAQAPMPVVPPAVETGPVVLKRTMPAQIIAVDPPQPAAAPEPAAPPEPAAAPVTTPTPPTPPAAPVASEPPAAEPANSIRIQVASLRDEAGANTAWERVASRNPEVFQSRRRVITQAEVKGTTYYRAQLAGFASQAEARAACEAVKANGSDCLVVGR